LRENYNAWDEAKAHRAFYESKEIFGNLVKKNNALLIKNNYYEQDDVFTLATIKPIELPNQINLISKDHEELFVIDYGGSLANIFRNNKKKFQPNISLDIVEQKHIVNYGKKSKFKKY
jgi:putative methyltransferase (TIGR04325 family)